MVNGRLIFVYSFLGVPSSLPLVRNNKREVELLEIRNREEELGKDIKIELVVRERQHANKTGTIPKAKIRNIETISRPSDKDGQSKDTLQKHNVNREIINGTHKGMLSPNTENTLGYWRILEEEENLDLDKIKFRELELEYLEREREIKRSEMKKLDKERLEIEKIIKKKLEKDKLELEIYKRMQREEKDRTFEIDSFIETSKEFRKEAEILIENEEQKNDKSKIQELTLEIESLKEKMEQI